MKKYYKLVASIYRADKSVEAIEITRSDDMDEICRNKEKLIAEINDGKYEKYVDREDNEFITVDIEAYDWKTHDLLWIE